MTVSATTHFKLLQVALPFLRLSIAMETDAGKLAVTVATCNTKHSLRRMLHGGMEPCSIQMGDWQVPMYYYRYI